MCTSDDANDEPCFDLKPFNYNADQKAQIDKSIELECYVKHKGRFSVIWMDESGVVSFNDQLVKPDSNIILATDSNYKFNLKISHVGLSHKGSYKCQISTLKVKNLDYNLDILSKC